MRRSRGLLDVLGVPDPEFVPAEASVRTGGNDVSEIRQQLHKLLAEHFGDVPFRVTSFTTTATPTVEGGVAWWEGVMDAVEVQPQIVGE